ncbi:GMP synthase (glutamine-hydrolysing) [Shimia gijangensis]|uniref:GMP synthase (Glutamine-hydrolysing) n=1 Tax=Shimia gijangensis TaxID=1470563 RepID=A0A1M6JMQ0_9RHOB|nr:type 1 glutamine amidotransferase [Shimia gijangensis]SHJ47894.1 GMP synthase (glutamine-hydrolysing) [Shimia gijangensis]
MTTILIIEGHSPETVQQGRSYAASFLSVLMAIDPGLRIRVQNPNLRPVTADDFTGVDGVVFTGSAVEWNTSDPRGKPQADAMKAAFAEKLPCWGSCNGLQLLATVLGGTVGASPNGHESGLARDIRLTEAGKSHPMMAGRQDGFASPCIHRDEIQTLPKGAVLMAGNAHSPVQAVAYKVDGIDFWGTQYHPELTPEDIAGALARVDADKHAEKIADLMAASTDPDAAARLGTTPDAMGLPDRTRELSNWLEHVKARA